MNLRKNKAFTLIELLVVIAIIGILAALIIVSLSGAREKAQDTQLKNNARNLDTALAQYYLDNQSAFVTGADDSDITAAGLCTSLADYLNNGTAACVHPNTDAIYETANAAADYAQAWELNSSSETATNSGNGVYSLTNGVLSVNSITLGNTNPIGGGANNDNAFVTFGPQ